MTVRLPAKVAGHCRRGFQKSRQGERNALGIAAEGKQKVLLDNMVGQNRRIKEGGDQ
jgi:hypothetical protein